MQLCVFFFACRLPYAPQLLQYEEVFHLWQRVSPLGQTVLHRHLYLIARGQTSLLWHHGHVRLPFHWWLLSGVVWRLPQYCPDHWGEHYVHPFCIVLSTATLWHRTLPATNGEPLFSLITLMLMCSWGSIGRIRSLLCFGRCDCILSQIPLNDWNGFVQ